MNEQQRRARVHHTLDAAMERIFAYDMPAFARMWAPDGVMEFPFAVDPGPRRLEGRDAIVDYLSVYNDLMLPKKLRNEKRHDTADPDTVVFEFEVDGQVVADGRDYTLGYVWIITVGDEGIVRFRDYWSPYHVSEVIGTNGELKKVTQ